MLKRAGVEWNARLSVKSDYLVGRDGRSIPHGRDSRVARRRRRGSSEPKLQEGPRGLRSADAHCSVPSTELHGRAGSPCRPARPCRSAKPRSTRSKTAASRCVRPDWSRRGTSSSSQADRSASGLGFSLSLRPFAKRRRIRLCRGVGSRALRPPGLAVVARYRRPRCMVAAPPDHCRKGLGGDLRYLPRIVSK